MPVQTGWRWVGVPALELRDGHGRLRQALTANEAPRRFALVAMTAAAPEGRVSRTEIRRRLFSDVGADSVRQTIRRAQAAGWVRVDGEDVILEHARVAPTEPLRFVHDLLVSTPGNLLPTEGWSEGLPAEFTQWWCAWRLRQQDVVVTALMSVVEAKWTAGAMDEAWAGLHHLERWASDHPRVQVLHARMNRASDEPVLTGRFVWPQIPRPEVTDPLVRHLTENVHPGVTAAFIQGDAGAGKTSLLEAVILQASATYPGMQVVRVAGDWVPSEAADSAWMKTATRQRLIDAVLAVPSVGDTSDGQWLRSALLGTHSATVLRDRLAWIEALRGAWRVALESAATGLWLVLDDVQWIDQETQQLLTALLTMRTDHAWWMMAASRTERPALWTELARRTPEQWADVHLAGLADTAIALVALQTQAPPSVVADAYRYAEGHPFRWRELVRRALTHGRVPDAGTLTDLLGSELASWSTAELQLAFAVLLLGEFATWELLARVLGTPPTAVEEAARPLRHRGIVEPSVEQPSVRVWIAADRWRDAILQAADQDMRRAVHRRVGEVLDGSILLRERLDVQLRIVEHERQGGALEAAAARVPEVAARAAKSGLAVTAHALWTAVLREVSVTLGTIPTQMRRQWAECAILNQVHTALLPRTSKDELVPEEQILQAFQAPPADGDDAQERHLDALIAVAGRGMVSPAVRAYATQHGVVANETLSAGRARTRRQRMLRVLASDPHFEELPRSTQLWYAYFTCDWTRLEHLLPEDPTSVETTAVLATITTLRLLGMSRRAWAVGAAALARPETSAYLRWATSSMMIGTADAIGDYGVLRAVTPIVTFMREQVADIAMPAEMHRISTQVILMAVANGAAPWDSLADNEIADTWEELKTGKAFANAHRLAAQGLAMFLLATRGRRDHARAWLAQFQQRVAWRDVFVVSEDGASNFAWRMLLIAEMVGDPELAARLRHQLREYPALRAWAMREPTIIPRTLCAYYGCLLHEIWGAEVLRPVRSIEESMQIARMGSLSLPAIAPPGR